MITSKQCFAKYGDPTLEKHMVVYDVPWELEIGFIPKRIYCNKDLVRPLNAALSAVVGRKCANLITSWDGCFNIRKKRGAKSKSLHSWGVAIDINAAHNQYGVKPKMDPRLVKCFTDNGFEWGGEWSTPDGMHFQLARI